MIKNKAQAALEFLMTYGWMILVVLAAVAVLAYFGVLSPDRFLPAKCQLPAGFACTDFKLESTQMTVVIRNGVGFDATGVSISVSGCTDATGSLSNGKQASFVMVSCLDPATGLAYNPGSKYSGDFNLTYTNADTLLDHKIQGSITGRIE